MHSAPIRSTDNRDLAKMEEYRTMQIEALKAEIRRLQIEVAKLKEIKIA